MNSLYFSQGRNQIESSAKTKDKEKISKERKTERKCKKDA